MIKTRFNLSLLLLVVLAHYACSPIRVISNELDPQANTEKYHTFNFYDLKVKAPQPEEIRESGIDMLKDAIQNELEAVGLEKSENPNIWVNIGIVIEDKVQTRQTDIREAPMYIGQRNYHWESEEVLVDEYKEGTVTIDLIDARTNEMVGQSVASGVIVENENKLKQRIDKGMAKVFQDLWASRQQ